MNTFSRVSQPLALSLMVAIAFGGLVSAQAFAQQPITKGAVTIQPAPPYQKQGLSAADIADAIPMPMPSIDFMPADAMDADVASQSEGEPGFTRGSRGNGEETPARVPLEEPLMDLLDEEDLGIEPSEYGTANHPYTTARVDTSGNNVSKTYPFRAAGKLYFKKGSSTFVCSASLIKRGVVVTAAHCVADYGKKKFYTNFQFVPAKYNTIAPYGIWNHSVAIVMTAYFNGTDVCAPGAKGIVCKNDVAVIRLAPKSGKYPGTSTGWLGYGWNGFGFTPNKLALINQLGYPVSHDSGNIMHRTDSEGFVAGSSLAGNTVWGGRQTGGSSGGPEVVNLGIRGKLSTPLGKASDSNIVVGTTSWGYTNSAVKQQGASPFLSTNILPLVNAACGKPVNQAACK